MPSGRHAAYRFSEADYQFQPILTRRHLGSFNVYADEFARMVIDTEFEHSRYVTLEDNKIISNESMQRLMQIDLARYFAEGTGTHVWVGIKIFPRFIVGGVDGLQGTISNVNFSSAPRACRKHANLCKPWCSNIHTYQCYISHWSRHTTAANGEATEDPRTLDVDMELVLQLVISMKLKYCNPNLSLRFSLLDFSSISIDR